MKSGCLRWGAQGCMVISLAFAMASCVSNNDRDSSSTQQSSSDTAGGKTTGLTCTDRTTSASVLVTAEAMKDRSPQKAADVLEAAAQSYASCASLNDLHGDDLADTVQMQTLMLGTAAQYVGDIDCKRAIRDEERVIELAPQMLGGHLNAQQSEVDQEINSDHAEIAELRKHSACAHAPPP